MRITLASVLSLASPFFLDYTIDLPESHLWVFLTILFGVGLMFGLIAGRENARLFWLWPSLFALSFLLFGAPIGSLQWGFKLQAIPYVMPFVVVGSVSAFLYFKVGHYFLRSK